MAARSRKSTRAAKKPRKSTRMTKKDLEAKIKKLESKIDKLASPATSAKAAPPRGSLPKGTAPPQPKASPPPPQPSSARGSLPKGTAPSPASTTAPPPKPQEKRAPATVAAALEDAYQNAPIVDTFGEMRAKITGYTPAPSRYFTRNTAPTGTVPTSDWNLQKATVTGYTQPSNQYFATRQRLAYHPPEKRFTGYGMRVNGTAATTSAPPPPPPPPSSTHGSLPKGMSPPPPQPSPSASTSSSSSSSSRTDELASYEEDYLKRLEQEAEMSAEIERVARERMASKTEPASGSSRGTLPKGF